MSETNLSRRRFIVPSSKNSIQTNSHTEALLSNNLDPFEGEWNFETANHLLRRTTYGANYNQVLELSKVSLAKAIDILFSPEPLPKGPINYDFEQDVVPIGEVWVDQPLDRGISGFRAARQRSVEAWTFNNIYESPLSIREKMVFFWQNHFAIKISITREPNFIYHYSNTMRENATGNFKTLVEQMTIEPAMLHYLNGHQNRNGAPNENYARELFELYTIGKGALAGPNDYTTFTEDDVVEAAKVLTGWIYLGQFGNQDQPASSTFRINQHDTTTKQFSHRFDNAIINSNGEAEYLDLINMIFNQDEVSRFICRKLYRWFVHYDITPEIEANIIEPLAEIMRNNNHEIEPVLRTLLSSCHFYDQCNRGVMVKNPVDFIMNLMRQHEVEVPSHDLVYTNGRYARMDFFSRLFNTIESNDMEYYEPPTVAGWKAYYQEPLFYKSWINSVTLGKRQIMTTQIVNSLRLGGFIVEIDLVKYIESFENPFVLDDLVTEIVRHIFPSGLSEFQINGIKDILENWNNEYGEYVSEPNGTDRKEELREGIKNKLNTLFETLFHMPEYYLS